MGARYARYLGDRAAGGAGVIIAGQAQVHATSAYQMTNNAAAWPSDAVDGFRLVTDAIHEHGALAFIQLAHNGGVNDGSWSKLPVWSPSGLSDYNEPGVELTEEMIAELIAAFATAAANAAAGGFDGIEVHGAHGYLIHEFLSPKLNRRTDRWGGDLEGRMGFAVEVLRAARAAVGGGVAVGLRLVGDEEHWDGSGLTPDDCGDIAARLEALGVIDFLDVSVGTSGMGMVRPLYAKHLLGVAATARVKAAVGDVPVFAVHRILTPDEAEGVLERGEADAITLVRALIADKGDQIKEAPPSTPVQVLGFSDVPAAGDDFRVTVDDRTARTIGEMREQRFRSADLRKTPSLAGHSGGAKLEDLFEQIQRGETTTLNLVLKADVQGSLEAVTESLRKLERDEVKLSFVHRAVGGITENDVQLAAASNATIIGFSVRPDRKSREAAERTDVEIRTYEIIYKLLEDVESAIIGMLAPEFEEVITGEAEVRQVFTVPKVGAIAGCYVRSGVITRGSKVRFLRDGVIIWKGAITTLRRFKDDAREVAAGYECGIGLTNNQDLKDGDIIETFDEREIPRT